MVTGSSPVGRTNCLIMYYPPIVVKLLTQRKASLIEQIEYIRKQIPYMEDSVRLKECIISLDAAYKTLLEVEEALHP